MGWKEVFIQGFKPDILPAYHGMIHYDQHHVTGSISLSEVSFSVSYGLPSFSKLIETDFS